MTAGHPAAPGTPRVRLRLFGSFEGALDDAPVHLPTRKIEALLAYLVLHPAPHAREKLAALFWGDVPDDRARVSLRYALARLRQAFGPKLLLAGRETAQINPEFPIWVDARAFQAQAPEARIENYRGDLLADFYADWVLAERDQFRQAYIATLLELIQRYRAASDYPRAIAAAEQVLASEPAHERAHQHLMFCFVALCQREAALHQYARCVAALREDLAVDPAPDTTALYEWIKHAPSQLSPAVRITNLPIPLTSFIGREQEMAQIKRRLRPAEPGSAQRPGSAPFEARLLTLTGAGGCGKTRLAIQAATDLIDAYRDGVWWVELAALADGALVPLTVANALGLHDLPQQTLLVYLANFLREKHLLLVIDNCEHLLEACAQLARALLASCAHLQILATSREAMDLIGESVQAVSTLAFPNPADEASTAELLQFPAVQLFLARTAAVRPHFKLRAQNAGAVALICARLDGIPLALELAAARMKDLDAAEIAARLEQRFSFLTRGNRGALPRHQTLRALFDWSYDLLSEPERLVLGRLSVFAGGWTPAAAEFVCAGPGAGPGAVSDVVLSLQEKSLVQVEPRGEHPRQRLLETVHEFARDKRAETGEDEWLNDRHLTFFQQMAEDAEPHLAHSAERRVTAAGLNEDLDNLRAALRWALASQPAAGLRILGSLAALWTSIGHIYEGLAWSEQMLAAAAAEAPAGPSLARVCAEAKTLTAAGFLAFVHGDYAAAQSRLADAQTRAAASADWRAQCDAQNYYGTLKLHQGDAPAARALHERSVALARQEGDVWMLAYSLWFLGDALTYLEPAQARAVYEESVALFRQAGDRYFAALPMASLAHLAAQEGAYSQACALLQECLALRREEGHEYLTVNALNSLAEVLCYQGDYENAAPLGEEALSLSRKVANKSGIAWSLRNLGDTAAGQGQAERATAHLQESLRLYRELGQTRDALGVIESLAEIAYSQDRPEHAGALWSAASALRAAAHMPLAPFLRSARHREAAQTRAERAGSGPAPGLASGPALTLEQAIELALSQ
jgi:predicted ATPase/DNA-binding SARP family transcriptional activator